MSETSSKEQLEENQKYRFETYDLVKSLNEENLEEISEKIKAIISENPEQRIENVLRMIYLKASLYGSDLMLITKLIIAIFGTIKNPNFGSKRKFFCKYVKSACKDSRYANIIFGHLYAMDALPPKRNYINLQNIFRFLCSDYASFSNCLYAISLFIQCHDKIKNEAMNVYAIVLNFIKTLLSYYFTPQAASCLSEFNAFLEGEKKVYELYPIIKNDLVDELKKIKDLKKDQIYFPSIYDESPLVFCPSLLAAAAYFNANKCVEYLHNYGFSPKQEDLMGRSFAYFAGLSGNTRALEIVGKAEEMNGEFVSALIESQHNDLFLANPIRGPIEDSEYSLHIACIYNNFELAETILKQNLCDINQEDDCEDLPQHIAARAGNTECIIKLAMSPDFHFEAKNFAEINIYKLATQNKHKDLKNILASYMNLKPRKSPTRNKDNELYKSDSSNGEEDFVDIYDFDS